MDQGKLEDPVALWLRRARLYPLLTADQEIQLAHKIRAGDRAAFEEMFNSNLRLVTFIAKKFTRNTGSHHFEDLLAPGSIGLMQAIKKFDVDKGCKLSTYASHWISQAISRSIADNSRQIRIPVHIFEFADRCHRANDTLTQQFHRAPSPEEICRYLKISLDCLLACSLEENISSIDVVLGQDEDLNPAEIIPDLNTPDPIEDLYSRQIEAAVLNCPTLTDREKQMIAMRYGLGEHREQPRTLDQIGAKFKLSRERIRQIISRAEEKLKQDPDLISLAEDHT